MDIRDEVLDELLDGYEKPDDLLGDDGLLKRLKKKLWGGRRGFGTIVALCRTDEGAP